MNTNTNTPAWKLVPAQMIDEMRLAFWLAIVDRPLRTDPMLQTAWAAALEVAPADAAPQDERAVTQLIATFETTIVFGRPDERKRARDALLACFRAALPAQAVAPAEQTCPGCLGSGESTRMVGGGPDAYAETCLCAPCGGTGAAIAPVADEPVILTDSQRQHYVALYGNLPNSLDSAHAVVAAVATAGFTNGYQAGKRDAAELAAPVQAVAPTDAQQALDSLLAAARAAVKYDEAIESCANSPARMSSFCSAEGDDLDALYADWQTKSRDAIDKATSAAPQAGVHAPAASDAERVACLIGQVYEASTLAAVICRQVAELPDRNSPEEWPEAMLVTGDELHQIVRDALIDAQPAAQPADAQPDMFWDDADTERGLSATTEDEAVQEIAYDAAPGDLPFEIVLQRAKMLSKVRVRVTALADDEGNGFTYEVIDAARTQGGAA